MTLQAAARLYRLRRRAKVAQILDYFHGLHPLALAELTDRQIDLLFLHQRDEGGKVVFPKVQEYETPTLEAALRNAALLKAVAGGRLANYDELIEQIYKKFGAERPKKDATNG